MRFVPKAPREGINVSPTHPLADAGILILGVGLVIFFLTLLLVFFVEIAVKVISPKAEVALFENWQPELWVAEDTVDHRQAELQALLDRLRQHAPESGYDFRLSVSSSAQANAMALPGGRIVVTQGLLDQVESENELALVLGHELGHFHNRDHLRGLGRGVLLSVLLAFLTGGDVAGIGSSVADLTVRSFGREQETDADEFGLHLVHKVYGHTAQASRLFERWDEQRAADDAVTPYLSTHPSPSHRIDDMHAYAETQGWRTHGPITPLSWLEHERK